MSNIVKNVFVCIDKIGRTVLDLFDGGLVRMNAVAEYLSGIYPEVDPLTFYRGIFPAGELDQKNAFTKGKYTGIAVRICQTEDGSRKIHRYTVTDDLDVIRELMACDDFCVMSPVSYAGKSRKTVNARRLYALCIEVDGLVMRDGKPLGLMELEYRWQHGKKRPVPVPTYAVASGSGVHLYYAFKDPIRLTEQMKQQLGEYKRFLTQRIWNAYVTELWREEQIQYESWAQAFRMPGTITKHGERTRAFLVGGYVDLDVMNGVVPVDHPEWKLTGEWPTKRKLRLADAKEKYPEWYERRIVRKMPKGSWTCHKGLYDWWLRRICAEAQEGHRYTCLMILCAYAIKAGVDRETLEADALKYLDAMDKAGYNEPFTEKDMLDALQSFEDKFMVRFTITSIERRSALRIERNVRHGRKQAEHLKIARFIQSLKYTDGRTWRYVPETVEDLVKSWCEDHPGASVAECVADTGLAKSAVYRWWTGERLTTAAAKVKRWRLEHPDGTKTMCQRETGVSHNTVTKYWMCLLSDDMKERDM